MSNINRYGPDRYAGNNLDAYVRPNCPRCGVRAECDFYDDTRWGEGIPVYRPNRHWCETPGCVNENGYNHVPLLESGE